MTPAAVHDPSLSSPILDFALNSEDFINSPETDTSIGTGNRNVSLTEVDILTPSYIDPMNLAYLQPTPTPPPQSHKSKGGDIKRNYSPSDLMVKSEGISNTNKKGKKRKQAEVFLPSRGKDVPHIDLDVDEANDDDDDDQFLLTPSPPTLSTSNTITTANTDFSTIGLETLDPMLSVNDDIIMNIIDFKESDSTVGGHSEDIDALLDEKYSTLSLVSNQKQLHRQQQQQQQQKMLEMEFLDDLTSMSSSNLQSNNNSTSNLNINAMTNDTKDDLMIY